MWKKRSFKENMAELAGPLYTRHEPNGTRTITVEEYCEETIKIEIYTAVVITTGLVRKRRKNAHAPVSPALSL